MRLLVSALILLMASGGARSEIILGSPASGMNVFDRDLVVHDTTAKSIVKEHSTYSTINAHLKETKETVLVYVTPWNNRGYDIAKVFRGKFTHISPVWYTIKPTGEKSFGLEGSHDVDREWINEVTVPTPEVSPKIVPRFQMADFEKDHILMLAHADEEVIAKLSDLIVKECIDQKFDGFVLEFHLSGYTPILIETLSKQARKSGLLFFLVIPPLREDQKQSVFDQTHFDRYKAFVDGFSLMTYDYSTPQSPGPNAPLTWIEENVMFLCPEFEDRHKLLIGINMYGNDFSIGGGAGTIVGSQYIEILKKHNPKIRYIEEFDEHKAMYVDAKGIKHELWYPTLKSLDERLLAIEEMGTGISVWEIGQGLDYFYDLF
ncbi:Chitinase domain-containing protein 1 [Dinochytrium kinnereticum]|nr:Chitinase domain-containing protein 1 [Dinochytrium kinnereticum]